LALSKTHDGIYLAGKVLARRNRNQNSTQILPYVKITMHITGSWSRGIQEPSQPTKTGLLLPSQSARKCEKWH
jgi:hypothetical protein